MTPTPLLQLIRAFEGCRLRAYVCPAGVWTIGWGATGPGIQRGVEWDQITADARLKHDAAKYVAMALKLSPVLAAYPDKLAAIADFCYNLGPARYKASTLRRKVNAQDWDGAACELGKWVWGGGRKLPGLVKRRAAEAALLRQDFKNG